jgi:hypothetical protein
MERHDGENHDGKWVVRMTLGDEISTYVIPFEMVEGELYMCYALPKQFDVLRQVDWSRAKMVMLRYDGLHESYGTVQPRYSLVEGEGQLVGPGLVLPFKRIGRTSPSQERDVSWT